MPPMQEPRPCLPCRRSSRCEVWPGALAPRCKPVGYAGGGGGCVLVGAVGASEVSVTQCTLEQIFLQMASKRELRNDNA